MLFVLSTFSNQTLVAILPFEYHLNTSITPDKRGGGGGYILFWCVCGGGGGGGLSILFFLFFYENICCGYSLEVSHYVFVEK